MAVIDNNGRLAAINISNEDTFALSVARSGTKSPAKAADYGPAAPHRLLMLMLIAANRPLLTSPLRKWQRKYKLRPHIRRTDYIYMLFVCLNYFLGYG